MREDLGCYLPQVKARQACFENDFINVTTAKKDCLGTVCHGICKNFWVPSNQSVGRGVGHKLNEIWGFTQPSGIKESIYIRYTGSRGTEIVKIGGEMDIA